MSTLTLTPTRSRRSYYLRLSRNNHTMTTARPMCVLSPIHPVLPLYLVCVEQLTVSMWTRRCVLAHKLTRTPRLLRPTVSPLPLSPTVGQ